MLNVDGGDDVDAGVEELVDVLVAFGVARPGRVGVGELVDEHQLGAAGEDGVDVHLLEHRVAVLQPPTGHHRQVSKLLGRVDAAEHLSRGFGRVFGVTPQRFRLETRARAALADLSGPATLAEVAALHGFADQAHMTRSVRDLTGATPGAWKRSNSFKT